MRARIWYALCRLVAWRCLASSLLDLYSRHIQHVRLALPAVVLREVQNSSVNDAIEHPARVPYHADRDNRRDDSAFPTRSSGNSHHHRGHHFSDPRNVHSGLHVYQLYWTSYPERTPNTEYTSWDVH